MDSQNQLAREGVAVAPARGQQLLDALGRPYEPAIGPRLKILLALIFAAVAVLGATAVYLLGIRALEWLRYPTTYTNQFTLGMFMVHEVVGVLIVAPFLFFGLTHLRTARHRKNRLAVRLGISLFLTCIVVGLTGLALIQLPSMPQLPTGLGRTVTLILHSVAPVAAVVFYVLHRRAGPEIRWKWGVSWGVGVCGFVAVMCGMHSVDPRPWYQKGSPEGEKYFEPSLARTSNGKFIPERALMMDEYCLKCHADIYKGWFHSAHHFSSFNNPPYLFSVRETRKVSMEHDGTMRGARWCAGCHDAVPFLSGKFDDPHYDDVNDPTARAGVTCVVCHAMVNLNSTRGNGDYTIEEPLQYPFAYSKNPVLQWLNNQVVKAKPDFHKKTFLKPFHKTAEFCSVCHKVSIPMALNYYKEFLRGQNHYDSFLLSGVSGVSARSFYYPPKAKATCAECHMPLQPSNDFGRRDRDGTGIPKIHNHLFPAANTGLAWLLSLDPKNHDHAEAFRQAATAHSNFLRGSDPRGGAKAPVTAPTMRIDIFGLKSGGTINGQLVAPLRPAQPVLEPGQTYLVEVVVRTLTLGHPFTQGTADSNEIWVDFTASSAGKLIGESGALDGGDRGRLDEWAHRINVLMLDRHGNRINRRNPQDIFTPLYNHQIPPGAAQVIHYQLHVPKNVKAPIELQAKLRYRKFDFEYLSLVYGGDNKVPPLPIVDLCEDSVTLPVQDVPVAVPIKPSPIKPAWQRWNDYGIGCFLEGGVTSKKGEFRQAEQAFRKLLEGKAKEAYGHAYLNLARIYQAEGRLEEAADVLNKARTADPPAPWWTVAWFAGLVNAQNDRLDDAIVNYEQILDPKNQPRQRSFDFTRDYVVINELGRALFDRAKVERDDPAERDRFLRRAVEAFQRTLTIDSENLDAHYGLSQCYALLGASCSNAETGQTAQSAMSAATDKKQLLALGSVLANAQETSQRRLEAAAQLGAAMTVFAKQPTDPKDPKLPTIFTLINQCRPLFQQTADKELATAAAFVLGRLHRQAHLIFKPDENAQDEAVAIYRKTHEAAGRASQAIVIYPLQHAGAKRPGH